MMPMHPMDYLMRQSNGNITNFQFAVHLSNQRNDVWTGKATRTAKFCELTIDIPRCVSICRTPSSQVLNVGIFEAVLAKSSQVATELRCADNLANQMQTTHPPAHPLLVTSGLTASPCRLQTYSASLQTTNPPTHLFVANNTTHLPSRLPTYSHSNLQPTNIP